MNLSLPIGIIPTVDFAFKLLFGDPAHPDVTIHFLNAIFANQPRIREVTILNPFLGKDTEDDKLAILDVRARDDRGRQINIEMQTALPQAMAERLTYYASSLFVLQLQEGDEYAELQPAVSICVLGQAMFPQLPDVHLDFQLRERRHGLPLTDGIQVHLLQLPNCLWAADNVKEAPHIEQWAYFLKNAGDLSRRQIEEQLPDSEFAIAAGVLEMIARNDRERMLYEARLKLRRDEVGRMKQAVKESVPRSRMEGALQTYQGLLGLPVSTDEELAALGESEVARITQELRQRLVELRS